MSPLLRESCLIDGRWVRGTVWCEVDDPATGEVIGRVPRFGPREARAAIEAAERALPAWSRLTALERGRILRRMADLMLAGRDELASLLTREQGKPLGEALAEIDYAAGYLEWFAEEGRRAYGDVIPSHAPDKRLVVLKQPIGVVAAITPWNFPAGMVTRKVAPALAAGCTMVLKPAEQTPFSALAIAALAEEAGLPSGVLNVITGPGPEIGPTLTASPIVRKLSFTGSTEVGALLYSQCAPTVKKLSLELGGNAPFIVFEDADLDAALAGAIASKFRNAGQTCVCANRIFVHAAVHDTFVERLADAASALKVGPGAEAASEIGPLIDSAAVAKVEAHLQEAIKDGARLRTGGRRHPLGGRYFEPTVVSNVTPAMRLAREETFGPVAPVLRFDTEDEVVAKANATPFGLAAYMYTRDLARTWRVAEAIEAGIVGINTGLVSTEVAPFGGVKTSGLGREGSRYGLDEYVEIKYLCVGS